MKYRVNVFARTTCHVNPDYHCTINYQDLVMLAYGF